MIDILLLIILVGGIIVGAKRGLIVQLIHMIGFVVALIVAFKYYKPLAEKFVLWVPFPAITSNSQLSFAVEALDLDQTFYRIIAFALIFFIVKFALQIVASMFDFLKFLPVLGQISSILGAILGFIEIYFLLFVLLYVLALLPVDMIQTAIGGSAIANFVLENTPFLSEAVKDWWYIYQENRSA
ncbi:putative membrane protein required for colicin V production [Chryseomicrobium aureum]|uniref:CvpA family protein n=1 Tax=Chryseomicrobium aureum TaxID=1441723 RepID=UPI0019594A3D|nr:CvpA family protein [Chryseomicrobium aureum]MBM7706728.1 putative membrane protein required for colicin V production [Chryseomicrobium aureum]